MKKITAAICVLTVFFVFSSLTGCSEKTTYLQESFLGNGYIESGDFGYYELFICTDDISYSVILDLETMTGFVYSYNIDNQYQQEIVEAYHAAYYDGLLTIYFSGSKRVSGEGVFLFELYENQDVTFAMDNSTSKRGLRRECLSGFIGENVMNEYIENLFDTIFVNFQDSISLEQCRMSFTGGTNIRLFGNIEGDSLALVVAGIEFGGDGFSSTYWNRTWYSSENPVIYECFSVDAEYSSLSAEKACNWINSRPNDGEYALR